MLLESFSDYILLEKKYSHHTLTAYRVDIESFYQYTFNGFSDSFVKEVSYDLVRAWIINLVESGVSNRSINRKVSSLKSFYKFLLKINEVEKSPLSNHRVLKVEKKIQIPFSKDEVKNTIVLFNSLDKNFKSSRDRLIVELLYSTGIRRSELIDIKNDSIDFENSTVKVLGKRKKERIIPLLPLVLNSIKEYIAYRDNEFSFKCGYFFVSNKGNKLYETFVYRVVNSYFSKTSSKVKKSPHILRHSFATHLLNEGADLNSLKELLGHTSLAATQNYTHSDISELKKTYKNFHPRGE